jgi:SAM-dependent methyltransferase
MRIFRDSPSDTWKHFGENDPYFGVISHDKFRSPNLNENTREEFFEAGRREIERLMSVFEKIPFATSRALDFGCGVGRLTNALSPIFLSVVGVDISPHMLREAERNTNLAGLTNVTFDTDIPKGEHFEFVHSLYVLQHIDKRYRESTLSRLWDAVSPNGIMAVQIPTKYIGGRLVRLLRIARDIVPFIQVPLNILRGDNWNRPGMQMNLYDLNEISFFLLRSGATSITLIRHDSDQRAFSGVYVIVKKCT